MFAKNIRREELFELLFSRDSFRLSKKRKKKKKEKFDALS